MKDIQILVAFNLVPKSYDRKCGHFLTAKGVELSRGGVKEST